MAVQHDAVLAAPLPRSKSNEAGRSLFSPVVDFFLLGGGSIIIFAILAATVPVETGHGTLITLSLLLAHVINHPHFAHSYQIFYRDFGAKIRGRGYPNELRVRYVAAGIVVPIILALLTCVGIASGHGRVLGLAANVMYFFVGWHYVKQGYGMLMLDAALKKRFFEADEKSLLLVNAYVTWICHWALANVVLNRGDFWGLRAYTIDIPMPLLLGAIGAAALTTIATAVTLVRKAAVKKKPVPVNGLTAYVVSIYIWTFAAFYPIVGALTSVFHSLQYLAVVWRYRLNSESSRPDASETPLTGRLGAVLPKKMGLRFMGFIALGTVLGYVGFWAIPKFLNAVVPYDRAEFGPTLFLFVFWIFINVHHYFLDNVMWRRGNPDVQKHLFA